MEKVKLGELLIYEQPTKYIVESDQYDNSYETPVLTAGKSFLLGYTDEKDNIFTNIPVIIFDDFTTATQYVDFSFKVKSSAMKILNCNYEKADIRYMFYLLQTIKVDSERHKRYWISEYAELQIPLPPLSTQKAIAHQLDKAQELVNYNQQLLEKYDELQQSLFLEMFGDPVMNEKGWDFVKLDDKANVGSSKRVFVKELVDEGVPFFRGTEVGKLGNDEEIEPTLFITKEHYKDLRKDRGVPKLNDLLLPSICPDGRIWRVTNNNPFYFKDGRVLWISPKEDELNSEFLRKQLKYLFAANYSQIASGTTFAELKIISLKNLNILLPQSPSKTNLLHVSNP